MPPRGRYGREQKLRKHSMLTRNIAPSTNRKRTEARQNIRRGPRLGIDVGDKPLDALWNDTNRIQENAWEGRREGRSWDT